MPFFSRKSKPTVRRPAPPVPPQSPPGPGESRIHELGAEMLRRALAHKSGLLSAKFYSDRLMDWSMKDQGFKVQLFRFVDAFPMLTTPEAVHEHLADYLTQPGVRLPPGLDLGLKAGGLGSLTRGMMAATISSQIKSMASKFIAGKDAAGALPGLRSLWDDGIGFSVDLLGEACVSDAEADAYRDKYLDLIRNLPAQVAQFAPTPRLERDHLGAIPRVNVSIKVSSLSARCDPIDTGGAIADLMTRLGPILEVARDKGVFVNFDMEHHALKDLTLELFERCGAAIPFQGGLALQAYLKSGVEDARRVGDWARRSGRVITVRLVKGAYWDAETIKAEQAGWLCPVWGNKWETDACFERMTEALLDACPAKPGEPGVTLALGSHNVRSIAAALASLERRGLPREAIELQMLHGMADQLKHAAAEMDLRVREYVPVGEMIPGMAYFVRRLLENTSNESWLKAGFLDRADPAVLLRAPGPGVPGAPEKPDLVTIAPERHGLTPAVAGVGDGRPFFNEPLRDFSDLRQRQAFAAAVARATVPRPAPDKTEADVRAMARRAREVFPAWRDTDPRTRAAVLIRAAARMREQRDGLAGVMIREAGKTWREADADVCEAIDFCEFYARLAVPLFERARLGRFIGELDEQWYQPRGPAAVISPWNFPLAICCGMATAALVAGNPVIVKPAEQTPGIASILCDLLREALTELKAPPDAVQFCPGPGSPTGAALVRDPDIAIIAFTGSKGVGLDIVRAAGVTPDEQPFVKKVICEMGGKNAMIVDTSADFDEAVLAARQSAFGFQGQKCSACSRLIVVDPAGEDGPAISLFIRRFAEATRALVIGDPIDPGTDVGPVIDDEAAAKIARYIELGKSECRLELAVPVPAGLRPPPGTRHAWIGPHVFSRVRPDHAIARDEIFGPVVAIIHAPSFDDALAIANASPYKLTGGVFSRKPSSLERAKREFRVGNLYLNRGITGALVARQPFGGFGMSGVGSKAGGTDYLLQFVEPRASCENTMRRGFAPEL